MDKKDALEKKISEKERQLYRATKESHAWKKGKYKTYSNAQREKLFVESLHKEVAELHVQLMELEKQA